MHMIKKAIYLIKKQKTKKLHAFYGTFIQQIKSMELIALNLTCTEKESHGILTEVANWKVKSKIHKFKNTI
jgi:hypothetical protein